MVTVNQFNELAKLFELYAAGRSDAFDRLYGRLSSRMFSTALAYTTHAEDAEDIVHRVFVRVLKDARKLSQMRDPEKYIMTSVRNRALDHAKRVRRKKAHESSYLEHKLQATERDGTAATITDNNLLWLEQQLNSLEPESRELLILHWYEGMTLAAIAKQFGSKPHVIRYKFDKLMSTLLERYHEFRKQ